jgi:radical SAM superfamily enzyme YgiQ (UPF0313 family)
LIQKIKQKNKNCLVLVFSPMVDQEPELFLRQSQTDIAILGEVEKTVFELLDLISQNNNKSFLKFKKTTVAGIAFLQKNKLIKTKTRETIKLDDLPFLAHHLLYETKVVNKNPYQVTSKTVFVKKQIKWGFLLSPEVVHFIAVFVLHLSAIALAKDIASNHPKEPSMKLNF